MPLFAILFLALLSIPLIEVFVLIEVGRCIGAGNTIALVVLTAIAGAFLLRIQGIQTLTRVRGALERGEIPAVELIEGLILIITGALLLTPGFVTDAVGFICLLPGPRRVFARAFAARMVVHHAAGAPGHGSAPQNHSRPSPGGRTIEGDYRVDRD